MLIVFKYIFEVYFYGSGVPITKILQYLIAIVMLIKNLILTFKIIYIILFLYNIYKLYNDQRYIYIWHL